MIAHFDQQFGSVSGHGHDDLAFVGVQADSSVGLPCLAVIITVDDVRSTGATAVE